MQRFPGFEEFDIATTGASIHGIVGGSGPALLVLHGIPETHLMWHRVAPQLAQDFTVVATDLRGFGASSAPKSDPDHAPYSMRSIAEDQVQVMRELGHEKFAVAGHDRGARCGYRMALDHPGAVRRLAVLDIVPTLEAFNRADREFRLGYWVWSFLAAPEPVPEQLTSAAPQALVNHMLDAWSRDPSVFPPDIRYAYLTQFQDPARVHAICEEYRAAATIDCDHDAEDKSRQHRIVCPVLVLWSTEGPVGQWYDPVGIWQGWADQCQGYSVRGGHFLPEEAPGETLAELRRGSVEPWVRARRSQL